MCRFIATFMIVKTNTMHFTSFSKGFPRELRPGLAQKSDPPVETNEAYCNEVSWTRTAPGR